VVDRGLLTSSGTHQVLLGEEHRFNMLGMYANPVSGHPLCRQPNHAHLSLAKRLAERMQTITASQAPPIGTKFCVGWSTKSG
jgi:hypothetical protein